MKFAKIRTQMMSYYIVLLLVSMLVSGILYQRVNQNLAESKIGDLSLQTLYAVQSSLQAMFDNANKYSQRFVASATVQEMLKTNLAEYGIAESNQKVQKTINEILLAEPTISSVYLFRNDDVYFYSDNLRLLVNVASIRNASWYKEVVNRNGGLIWRTNAGGVLHEVPNGESYLSLIRTVNDLVTAKQIGILIVNVPLAEIKKSYEHVVSGNKLDLMATWGSESLIPFTNPDLRAYADSDEFRAHPGGTFKKSLNGKSYLFASTESNGWQYSIALPINEWSNPYEPMNRVLIPIALFIFLLIFLGSIWISRSITGPLLSLLKSMRRAESGEFGQVRLSGGSEEIRQLQDRYNSMMATIEQSMQREKEEQRTRRRLELDILQQQIKPHFLYNSLESAGYLALTGEKEESYRLITALAHYYRQSLSKGDEVIALGQEFDIAKNYLTIQAMRYPGMFTAVYELEQAASDCPIPKLTLQPLVENALYHGIRPMGQDGTITVTAAFSDGHVTLTVKDDGVGMPEEKLAAMTDGGLVHDPASFGLRGTLTRLKLYYGDGMTYSIASAPGNGTVIRIVIPHQEGAVWNNEPLRPLS